MAEPSGNSTMIQSSEDYPLTPVPASARKSLWSTAIVLLGFTFFTATMFGGARVGVAFPFSELIWVIIAGNLLLGTYAAVLGIAAQKSGLSTVVMARFSFGNMGSRWVDAVLGFTQLGWYSWGSAAAALLTVKLLGLPTMLEPVLIAVFAFAFCWTAYVGYRGLEVLSKFAVPAMAILIFWSLGIATRDAGGLGQLSNITPTGAMGWGAAITIIFGTFASGGTQSTNWTRFAKTPTIAVIAALAAFFIGNGLMVVAGAYGALVYQIADMVEVLAAQGLVLAAVLLLLLNIWTTQDNTIYNMSMAAANAFRSEKRRMYVIAGVVISLFLSWFGIYDMLIPYLLLLGTFIPPIGGVIMADFFIRWRGDFPSLSQAKANWNLVGIIAYIGAALIAYYLKWGIAPINGIIAAVVIYAALWQVEALRPKN